jgi:hypothetical protein
MNTDGTWPAQRRSPSATPNETLIYDLELVSILPGPPQPTPEDIKK